MLQGNQGMECRLLGVAACHGVYFLIQRADRSVPLSVGHARLLISVSSELETTMVKEQLHAWWLAIDHALRPSNLDQLPCFSTVRGGIDVFFSPFINHTRVHLAVNELQR